MVIRKPLVCRVSKRNERYVDRSRDRPRSRAGDPAVYAVSLEALEERAELHQVGGRAGLQKVSGVNPSYSRTLP